MDLSTGSKKWQIM